MNFYFSIVSLLFLLSISCSSVRNPSSKADTQQLAKQSEFYMYSGEAYVKEQRR